MTSAKTSINPGLWEKAVLFHPFKNLLALSDIHYSIWCPLICLIWLWGKWITGKVENWVRKSFRILVHYFVESIYGHYYQSGNVHNECQGSKIIRHTAHPWACVSLKMLSKRLISHSLRQAKCAPQINMVSIKNATEELSWPILVSIFFG